MRFPVALETSPARWHELREQGYTTAFCFPFRPGLASEDRSRIADVLLEMGLTTVLFLKHLEDVQVEVDQRGLNAKRRWKIRRLRLQAGRWTPVSGLGVSGRYRVDIDGETDRGTFIIAHDADVPVGEHRDGLAGPAWDGVDATEVSIAVPVDGTRLEDDARKFHVFLPTQERCPYPFLVNGAFSTDLSRQRVRIAEGARDYNSHLVRHAARLLRHEVLPMLLEDDEAAALGALERRRTAAGHGAAADLLHGSISEELRGLPLLPTEQGDRVALDDAVLPPTVLGDAAATFRDVLQADATWKAKRFPSRTFCRQPHAYTAIDHGARELAPDDALEVLARVHDPERTRTVDDTDRFERDPLLEVCVALWEATGGEERDALEQRARREALFPVRRHPDRTLTRVALGKDLAFFPPRSARQDLPLKGLRFMSHELCWGSLLPNERQSVLEDQMKAWTALFDVREFRFETVVQAAIRPALVLHPDEAAQATLRELQDEKALAAICQLAGPRTKPDRPLRYQRLQSDRGLFPLSRLPVPCRGADGNTEWVPAFRAYFGEDWIGESSVERLVRTAQERGLDQDLEVHYLVAPERLVGLLQPAAPDDGEENVDDDDVGVDEDPDQALEADALERWMAFLSWIGVNRCLRLVHFYDVRDDRTGWLTTKNLSRPKGWAFASLTDTWASFERALRGRLDDDRLLKGVQPYIYEVHDLEHAGALLDVIEVDADATVARALLDHLARHWALYQPMTECTVALVAEGKSPGQRSPPQRALAEELYDAGPNLWLHRLRERSVCPTTHGPRPPAETWLSSKEVDRRFARRNRPAGHLLALLDPDPDTPAGPLRAIADRLGVRSELSPSTFTLRDARALCARMESISAGVTSAQLRESKGVYRELFELLSGQPATEEPPLRDVRLLFEQGGETAWAAAEGLLYASTPGSRERSGVATQVPTFVLAAEATVTRPLRDLFGVRMLEDALVWTPNCDDSSLADSEREAVREALRALVRPLLARIRVERSDLSDLRLLQQFVEAVEPVDELRLTCTLDGELLKGASVRPYFVDVRDGAVRAFVVWGDGSKWWSTPETAQALAMALADLLGLNLVETFYAFITSDEAQRRQLLDIAGGTPLLQEIEAEILDPDGEECVIAGTERTPVENPEQTAAADAGSHHDETPPGPGTSKPSAPRVPLVAFEALSIEGDPLIITGAGAGSAPEGGGLGGGSRDGNDPAGDRRVAPGTNLAELDQLGMRIAMAYELRRLRQAGHAPAPDGRTLVVDVHHPNVIEAAERGNDLVRRLFDNLQTNGVSRLWPGFDLLTIVDGRLDRAIELKSSGVDARVQTMSWNEWKTAGGSHLRERFWLYLAGNLRADFEATPYVRAIRDPFGTLQSAELTSERRTRAVQLRVREFRSAEHLDLRVAGDAG
jgi:hypothetical protein